MNNNIEIAKETVTMEFYNAKQVAEMLDCSRATAYRTIDQLNQELEREGFYTFSGKVSKKYFRKRMYI